ncbi:hypothetical protein RB195_004262 [Necator americanus]|uniref:C2H2-type domain-containing protein n=1 Tax=Necator americanus TaxID=51031 RepID=A0ABR1BLM7_NECAM
MSTEADSLRRSKRNKFHLDVAAMHLAHPERRRTQPGRLTPSPEILTNRASSLSPAAQSSPVSSEPGDEKPRRVRRIPVRNASYVYDDSDDDDCRRGLEGTNLCVKCPARFETRPGLANHFKLHFGEKRKFACELCDFSATTLKSLRFHRRVHDRFGVGPATLTDPHGNGIITVGDVLHCETSLGLGLYGNSSPPQLSPPAPFSVGLLRSNTEPAHLSTLASGSDSPSRQTRRNPGPPPPLTPPPNLVRATNTDIVPTRDLSSHPRKCTKCPYSAKTTARLKIHMIGHQKQCGFQCPFCSFKSESAGFLKRHVDMHGCASFAWPPAYVGISPRKLALIAGGAHSRCRSSMKVLFLQSALRHASSGNSKIWSCPVSNCNFAASAVSQQVVHHIRRHVPTRLRRFLRHICLKCGVCMSSAGALRTHRITRHTKRHHPRALQHFMRERVGYNYKRNFKKPKFELKEETECQPPPPPPPPPPPVLISTLKPETVKIEATDLVLQAIPICTESPEVKPKAFEFCCSLCPYGTSTRSNLLRHEAKHQVKDLFQCPHCSFSGRTLEFIEKHRRLHQSPTIVTATAATPPSPIVHGQPVVFVPVSTVIPQSLTMPLSNSPPVIAVSLSTSGGGPITVPYNAVAAHLPISLASVIPGIREQTLPLPTPIDHLSSEQKVKGLTRRSATEPSLRFIGSDGIKRRRCPLCPYTSKFSCDMRSHMEMHTMNARFKCSQCTYSTKRAVSLRSHLALHTEDNAVRAKSGKTTNVTVQKVLIGMKKGRGLAGFYNCAHCPFVTRICAELWRHARHHLTNAKGFNCSLCSFSSISLEVMEEHQLLHPEGAAFIRQNLVDDEDPASTPVTPNCVELKCDVCPFKTTIYQRMWNHKQKHKKTSRFVCSKCTFSTGSELCLEDHMVVHSEPGSGVDTGAAPSPTASAEIAQKSSSEKSESPDSQKAQGMFDSSKEGDGTAPSSADVTSNSSDLKVPLSIKIDNALRIMRPTKEVLPVLKRGRNNEVRRQCPDCPFVESDEMIFNMHREMHGGRTRAFACNLCNYSCFAAEALHWHLSLHLPPLSPASAVLQRRRGFGRRSFQTSDPIPLGAKHFSCTQCSFRTVNETTFVQHRQQHAQHIQQRLVTQMKRAATEEESRKSSKMKRVAKKSDKMHSCVRCAFRCDTTVAYSRHLEMHTQNALFKCRICDYSANTKKIVDFHEQNHHLDQSITQLRRNAILAPDIVQLEVSATDDERARIAGQEFRCKRCNFHTLEISTLAKHFEQHHGETEADREIAADLRMNLVPANSILTTA